MSKVKSSKRVHDSDSDDVPATKRGKNSANKSSTSSQAMRGDDGELYWELSTNRRVSVTSFKGKSMINIREYYEKDGKHLPGKKGIALPMEQYGTLIELLPQIEEALKSKGIEVGRPQYSNAETHPKLNEKAPGAVPEEQDEAPVRSSKKADGGSGNFDRSKFDKRNHEATSDEDD